jgi:sugar phosphate isomerase/epimerase
MALLFRQHMTKIAANETENSKEGSKNMAERLIGMAAGVVPELSPADAVEAAARGGFDLAGLWFDTDTWTAATTRAVRARLHDTGISAIDIEPIWLRAGDLGTGYFRLLDAGAELGAKNALLVSSDPDMAATAGKIAALCAHAAPLGIRVCLEFGLFTEVKNLAMALAVITQVDSPMVGLLIDPLHLQRSGGRPKDVASIPPGLMPYAQLCDAAETGPTADDPAGIIEEALDGRLQAGEGGLPLAELLAALPASIPLSVELRSKALRDGWPDAVERARVTADATHRFLEKLTVPAS